jgi:hypothetical protein
MNHVTTPLVAWFFQERESRVIVDCTFSFTRGVGMVRSHLTVMSLHHQTVGFSAI